MFGIKREKLTKEEEKGWAAFQIVRILRSFSQEEKEKILEAARIILEIEGKNGKEEEKRI